MREEPSSTLPTSIIILRVLLWAFGIALVCVVGVLAWLALLFGANPYNDARFSPQGWAEARDCSGLSDWGCEEKAMQCEAGAFVSSILKDHLVMGETTRHDVHLLLAAPDSPAERGREWEGRPCDLYGLGYCSGLGFDWDFLYVCYGPGEIVERALPVQH